jgi:guanylate kinase
MQDRGHDTPEEQARRREIAESEMQAASSFDHVVVNESGGLVETARRAWQIIAAEKRRRLGS